MTIFAWLEIARKQTWTARLALARLGRKECFCVQAGRFTVDGVLQNRSVVPVARGTEEVRTWYCALFPRRSFHATLYSVGAAATDRSSCRSGLTEKNLWRQGSQRN